MCATRVALNVRLEGCTMLPHASITAPHFHFRHAGAQCTINIRLQQQLPIRPEGRWLGKRGKGIPGLSAMRIPKCSNRSRCIWSGYGSEGLSWNHHDLSYQLLYTFAFFFMIFLKLKVRWRNSFLECRMLTFFVFYAIWMSQRLCHTHTSTYGSSLVSSLHFTSTVNVNRQLLTVNAFVVHLVRLLAKCTLEAMYACEMAFRFPILQYIYIICLQHLYKQILIRLTSATAGAAELRLICCSCRIYNNLWNSSTSALSVSLLSWLSAHCICIFVYKKMRKSWLAYTWRDMEDAQCMLSK